MKNFMNARTSILEVAGTVPATITHRHVTTPRDFGLISADVPRVVEGKLHCFLQKSINSVAGNRKKLKMVNMMQRPFKLYFA